MKDYTFAEMGMLLGAGIGGAIAVICFYLWSNVLFFGITAIGIALGVGIGNTLDKKNSGNRKNDGASDIK